MKKLLITALIVVAMVCMLAVSVSAAAPVPQKPTLDVSFGEDVTTIPDFVAPSELYLNTDERVLLVDENGNYVTYPTYYVTKNQTTFDFDFSKLNAAQSIQYDKKCVVMVEIPDGITTISNSYFAGTGNFPKCVSVQFPGSVTSYGSSLFASYNSVIKVVEFLDGTEPITMGDGMFGSQYNGGTANLMYVKFPNNLVSIGNNTFGKSWQSKTIILGDNLESIGTGFFGEATPESKDTFIYASSKLFADTAMFSNLFGSYAEHHSNHLKLTIFYTGTQKQAEDFVAAGKAIQTGYLWDDNKVTLVSANDYVYDTHKPSQRLALTMVYNYNACDAFYNSNHKNGAPTYGFADQDYISDFCENVACVNCGKSTSTKVLDSLFISKGYSKSGDAFMYDIHVNLEALETYESMYGEVNYGVVVSGNTSLSELINADGEATEDGVIKMTFDAIYTKIQIKFNGIETEENKAVSLHACAYVIANGKVSYIGNGVTTKTSTTICYNDIKNEE